MTNKPRSVQKAFSDGIIEIELSSWKWFGDYIQKSLLRRPNYIFRGQRKSTWPLEPTLTRKVRSMGQDIELFDDDDYLRQFKYATRGRRGSRPADLSQDEWWALAQHQGLPTPLLDWSESPFVALFFAFEKPREVVGDRRTVWALSRFSIAAKAKELAALDPPQPCLRLVTPQTDENPRLVSQRGLFTICPGVATHGDWIHENFGGYRRQLLIKLVIPERGDDRMDCLRYLNRMNINHLTLFPDLYGSAQYCATSLEISSY